MDVAYALVGVDHRDRGVGQIDVFLTGVALVVGLGDQVAGGIVVVQRGLALVGLAGALAQGVEGVAGATGLDQPA
ncbi:hypothetical protein GCM10027296_22880 [Chitinimonas naiadis]